jgi:hypothetical protein
MQAGFTTTTGSGGVVTVGGGGKFSSVPEHAVSSSKDYRSVKNENLVFINFN